MRKKERLFSLMFSLIFVAQACLSNSWQPPINAEIPLTTATLPMTPPALNIPLPTNVSPETNPGRSFILPSNDEWLASYEISKSTIENGIKFSRTNDIGLYIGQLSAYARQTGIYEMHDLAHFMRINSEKGVHIDNSVITDLFWRRFTDSLFFSNSSQLEWTSGFSEAALYNELVSSRQLKHISSGTDLFDLSDYLEVNKIDMDQAIFSPDLIQIPNSVFFNTQDVGKLAVGDTLFFPSHDGLPATVGVVVDKYREQGSLQAKRTVIFYNKDGTGRLQLIDTTDWQDLVDIGGQVYQIAGVFRSEIADQKEAVDEMLEKEILYSNDVPEIIKNTIPGRNIDFNQAPEIISLQMKLKNARTFKERGEILLKIVARMGILTIDGAEYDPNKLDYQWNEIPLDRCKAFSSEFIRAIGLGNDLSQWVDSQNIPSYNFGRELSTMDFEKWFKVYGSKYNWIPGSHLSRQQRLDLLKQGYIMYGAAAGHNWVIIGVEDEKGRTLPVLVQASYNMVELVVDYTLWPDSELPARQARKFDEPIDDTIWFHKLPGVK